MSAHMLAERADGYVALRATKFARLTGIIIKGEGDVTMDKTRLISKILTFATWICITALVVIKDSGAIADKLLTAAFCLSTLACALIVLDMMVGKPK